MPSNGAFAQSVIFHGLVVGAFVIGMPYLSREIAPEQPILTVDIVNVVPETSLDEGAEVQETPKPQPKQAEEPKTPSAPPPPPPPPPTPQPAPEIPPPAPKTADAVPVPSPEPKPVAAPKPEKPKSKPKPIKAPPKKPVKKSPVYKQAKQTQLALASKLQDLTDRQATLRRQKEEEEKKKKKARKKLDDLLAQSQKANEEDQAEKDKAEKDKAKAKLDQIAGQALNTAPRKSSLTGVSLGDLLRNHIGKYWSPPPGAAGADALIIDIIVRLNAQAEVQDVAIVDKARFNSDHTYKAAANAARRAIFDASPLPLPLDEYEQWKELTIKFDPSFITRR